MPEYHQEHKIRPLGHQQKPGRKKRRRKNTDGAWRKNQNTGTRDFSSFTTENQLRCMGAASLPADEVVLLNSSQTTICQDENKLSTPKGKHSSRVLTPSKYQASTPEAGPRTTYIVTKEGKKLLPSRVIELDDGVVSVFLSQDKVIEKDLLIPTSAKPWIAHSPIPEVSMAGMIDIPITKKKIKATDALTRSRKRGGQNPRKISQNQLNNIPATKAMRKAGIDVNDGDGHYLHFIPFSFIGDEAQVVYNMGIGTRFANAAMELVNPAIRRLLYAKNGPKVVYLSAIPEWVPGFEKIRLLKSITYIIKDGKGNNYQNSAKVIFNALSLREVCLTEVRPLREIIINKFSGKTPKKDFTSPLPTTPLSSKTQSKRTRIVPPSPSSKTVLNSRKPLLHYSPNKDAPQSPSFPKKAILPAYSLQVTGAENAPASFQSPTKGAKRPYWDISQILSSPQSPSLPLVSTLPAYQKACHVDTLSRKKSSSPLTRVRKLKF